MKGSGIYAGKPANDMPSELDIHATFFVIASLCAEMEDEMDKLRKSYHQIGCYGLKYE